MSGDGTSTHNIPPRAHWASGGSPWRTPNPGEQMGTAATKETAVFWQGSEGPRGLRAICGGSVPRLSSHFLLETTVARFSTPHQAVTPNRAVTSPGLAPAGGMSPLGTDPWDPGTHTGRRTPKIIKKAIK